MLKFPGSRIFTVQSPEFGATGGVRWRRITAEQVVAFWTQLHPGEGGVGPLIRKEADGPRIDVRQGDRTGFLVPVLENESNAIAGRFVELRGKNIRLRNCVALECCH